MKYTSTRDNTIQVDASRAILDGIAKDGGLYVPMELPSIDLTNEQFMEMDYKELAYNILQAFLTDFSSQQLKNCIHAAYDEKFQHPEIVPVTEALGISYLELQHGPTQAFKDMALSILPRLMTASMQIQSNPNKMVILAATSGDTGKAALEGFADVKDTVVVVFYPKDGVSEIQQKQMVTQHGENTFVIAIDGNFDDAQNGVKHLFTDQEFNSLLLEHGYELSSANSINIGRLLPQIVYYFYGYFQMHRTEHLDSNKMINIVVPTGNFGNILAAYYAMQMGLPVNRLICASNENNVLVDFFQKGEYDKNRALKLTISPSMDILVSSNLERLLFEISGRDSETVCTLMDQLKNNGRYELPEQLRNHLEVFYSNFATETETLLSIEHVYKITGHLLDTHTGVAHSVYEKYLLDTGDTTKTMIVSTASAYKFGKSVLKALGEDLEELNEFEANKRMAAITKTKIPDALWGLEHKPVRHNRFCSPEQMKTILTEILMNEKEAQQ